MKKGKEYSTWHLRFSMSLLFCISLIYAQDKNHKKLIFSGYGDIYYSYDFSRPITKKKADFLYNHKRNQQVNANLLLATAKYADSGFRVNLSAMTGDYAAYNLSSEPAWARYVYEANAGVRLSQKHRLWLDAGIMPSHIGFESAVSADCWTLTRSILAENSPYYEMGIKLGYTGPKERLKLAVLLLNGWQRIKTSQHYKNPSFGLQVSYAPNENFLFNYSNFVGSAAADSLKAIRTYHNLYAICHLNKKLGATVGFDLGSDKKNATQYGVWFSPVVILQYAATEKLNVALRGEYYADKNKVIIDTHTPNGFQVTGCSVNIDYKITDQLIWRIEGKLYDSRNPIFSNQERRNGSLTTNISFRL